jgi:hypothetical protein
MPIQGYACGVSSVRLVEIHVADIGSKYRAICQTLSAAADPFRDCKKTIDNIQIHQWTFNHGSNFCRDLMRQIVRLTMPANNGLTLISVSTPPKERR